MRSRIWKDYIDTDLVVVGHDSLIASYGYLPLILFFRVLGKRIIILGGGVGSYGSRIWSIFAKIILNKLDLITLREELSFAYLKSIGIVEPPMYVTADPAFLMQPISTDVAIELLKEEDTAVGERPLLGMTVSWISTSKHCFPELKQKEEKFCRYSQLMAEVIDNLVQEHDLTIVLISHVFGPENEQDDRIVIESIYRLVKEKKNVRVINKQYKAEEIKGIIGQLDLLVGERLHSVIAAVSMGTPVVAVTYPSPRMRGVAKMMEIEKWVYNVENLSVESIVTMINHAWKVRHDTKQHLMQQKSSVKEKAEENSVLIKKLVQW